MRFVIQNDNIRDTLTKSDLMDLDAEAPSKYRGVATKMNRLWDGYLRMEYANKELLADRELVLQKIKKIDLNKIDKDDLRSLIIEIEKILKP